MASALETVADYIADARVQLQDVIPPYRYDDDSLLTAFNVILTEARRLRADLFIHANRRTSRWRSGETPAYFQVTDERVPLEVPFRLPMVYGMIGHAMIRDQDDVQDARAMNFLRLFHVGLQSLSAAAQVTGGQ
jgi:hypothetical protein